MDFRVFRGVRLPLVLAVLCLGTTLCAAPASRLPDAPLPTASGAPGAAAPKGGVTLHAGRVLIPHLDAAPRLEEFLGSSLSGGAQQMLRISTFVQRYPEDGKAPNEPTTAFVGYTHEYFFIAFVCNDQHPGLIRAHMLARDSLSDDDSVQVMLDTFHDERRAFVFASNPLGIQADAMYSEQSGYDFSFDTVWDTWGKRTSTGYVVLMRIPFASLYFAKSEPGEMRTWGIILQRNVSHTNESDFWPRSNHDIAGRLSQDMEIEGFSDVGRGQNMQLEPYAIARSLRQLNTVNPIDPYFEDKHLQGYGGLDSKFILHNSLVLDTTVNPDFSQVGINNPAVPNQRFPPYFAEVRPFFIENSSYFMTPINLYYTNNIVKPQYGARLTGKLGRWAVGVLGVDDLSPGEAVVQGDPGFGTRAHSWVGRLNHDLGALSNAGLIYADREFGDSFNRAGGFDYRLRLRNRWTVTGQGITSQTRNMSNSTPGEQECENHALSCSGQAWTQQVSYSDLHWNWWTAYGDTSAGLVTDYGLLPAARRARAQRPPGIHVPAGERAHPLARTQHLHGAHLGPHRPAARFLPQPVLLPQLSPQHQRLGLHQPGSGPPAAHRLLSSAGQRGVAQPYRGNHLLFGSRAVPGRERRLQPGHGGELLASRERWSCARQHVVAELEPGTETSRRPRPPEQLRLYALHAASGRPGCLRQPRVHIALELPAHQGRFVQPDRPIHLHAAAPGVDGPSELEDVFYRCPVHVHASSGHRAVRRLHRELR